MVEMLYEVHCAVPAKVSAVGSFKFDGPLAERDEVEFNGLTWTVVEVRAEEAPPVAVLQLHPAA
jgi:hypothetical protein